MLVCLLAVFCLPVVHALDLEEQARSMGLEDLEKAGEVYTGEVDLAQGLDLGEIFRNLYRRGLESLEGAVKDSLRSCLLILVVTILCALAGTMTAGTGGDPMKVPVLTASLAIGAIALGEVDSLLGLGEETIGRMESLGDILLSSVAMAMAASGSPAAAAAKYGAAILFSDALMALVSKVLIPMVYAFGAVHVAWAALGNEGLRSLGKLLKWTVTTALSVLLLAFLAYLNFSGVIAGSADAATVKAVKFTISNLVPVVGGVISDTAETLLAGASILRNTAGVFGMLAVLGICLGPFLNLGLHYLAYKIAAALAATVAGDSRVIGLIEAIGTAFGLILAMAGACGVLLTVAMISAVSVIAI
ncbi:MAG: stage III sporulation protein AE [Ruminiclostridium sp.]|nr:stage III sporulation protein AE [Ruminiclostridium sp.]